MVPNCEGFHPGLDHEIKQFKKFLRFFFWKGWNPNFWWKPAVKRGGSSEITRNEERKRENRRKRGNERKGKMNKYGKNGRYPTVGHPSPS